MPEKNVSYEGVTEKVLVACPTYQGKSYALEAYLRAYKAFEYPLKSLFMVDNSGNGLRYFEHLKSLHVPCVHIDPVRDFQKTFIMCWKRMYLEAKKQKFDWLMSIEQDNICPPLTIDTMLNVAGFCKALHVCHSYPWHKNQAEMGYLTGLGCNLISVELLDAIFSRRKWCTDSMEAEVFEYPKLCKVPSVELHSLLDIKHLDSENGAEFNQFEAPEIPEMGAVGTIKVPIKIKRGVD